VRSRLDSISIRMGSPDRTLLYLLTKDTKGALLDVALAKLGCSLKDMLIRTALDRDEEQWPNIVLVGTSQNTVGRQELDAACTALLPGGKLIVVQPSSQVRSPI
jgi:hypothetical protein